MCVKACRWAKSAFIMSHCCGKTKHQKNWNWKTVTSSMEHVSAVKPMTEFHTKVTEEDTTGVFEPILDTVFFSREILELLLSNTEPQTVTEPALDDRVRELLGRFLDFMWSETTMEQSVSESESESERVDMRMSMPDELFL